MSKPRILIVEDESLVAADLADSLEEMGFNPVATVSTAEAAVEHLPETRPDLVLMDIKLPGDMDGIEAARRIHGDLECPVVFLTAFAEDSFLDRAVTTEPFGYLVKPVQAQELRATIRMALYKAKMEAERAELNRQLREALAEVKTLREILPVCAWCRKVRDDEGYWHQLEAYLEKTTHTRVTHGICPTCREKVDRQR